jgi:L-aspartate oxidase
MKEHFDVIVVGSGISGLSYALKVADKLKVAILTKTELEHTNTSYAQGGVATVMAKYDSYEKHINDTLITGDGLSNEEVVKMIVKEGASQIKELEKWGVDFDKDDSGEFIYGKEGGHSENRIVHHKDKTGFEIQKKLSQQVRNHQNITIFEYHFAMDIITQHHLGMLVRRCFEKIKAYGLYVLNLKDNTVKTFLAKKIYLATGGIGDLYTTTTNPEIATGDGIAMVYRAKGLVENMEFMQFHPTALYNPSERPAFLITEALRGAGAILKDINGNAFMEKYDKRGSLAPRDIVARTIDNEMKNSGSKHVFLDATMISKEEWETHFPSIKAKCAEQGIDVTSDYIPVIPAAHYLCGGVKVDMNGCSTIENLYAGGEVSSTGLHGANRLASNSLLEAIVYAEHSARHTLQNIKDGHDITTEIPDWDAKGTTYPEEMILITQSVKELREIMSDYVGIFRTDLRLKRALTRLNILYEETESLFRRSKVFKDIFELRNKINVAYLIVKMALERKESRGLHYNSDYPYKKPILK